MKKISFFLAAIVAVMMTFTLSSCESDTKATSIFVYGWDMDHNGTLSFDNMNMAYYLNSSLCNAVETAMKEQGLTSVSSLGWVTSSAISKSVAKDLGKKIVENAKVDSYTVKGYNYDFVIGFTFGSDNEIIEVYRKNLYKE